MKNKLCISIGDINGIGIAIMYDVNVFLGCHKS